MLQKTEDPFLNMLNHSSISLHLENGLSDPDIRGLLKNNNITIEQLRNIKNSQVFLYALKDPFIIGLTKSTPPIITIERLLNINLLSLDILKDPSIMKLTEGDKPVIKIEQLLKITHYAAFEALKDPEIIMLTQGYQPLITIEQLLKINNRALVKVLTEPSIMKFTEGDKPVITIEQLLKINRDSVLDALKDRSIMKLTEGDKPIIKIEQLLENTNYELLETFRDPEIIALTEGDKPVITIEQLLKINSASVLDALKDRSIMKLTEGDKPIIKIEQLLEITNYAAFDAVKDPEIIMLTQGAQPLITIEQLLKIDDYNTLKALKDPEIMLLTQGAQPIITGEQLLKINNRYIRDALKKPKIMAFTQGPQPVITIEQLLNILKSNYIKPDDLNLDVLKNPNLMSLTKLDPPVITIEQLVNLANKLKNYKVLDYLLKDNSIIDSKKKNESLMTNILSYLNQYCYFWEDNQLMLSIDIFLHKIINDKECTLQDDKVPAFIRFQKILENIMDRFEKLIEDLETNEDLQKKNPKLFKAIQQFHGGCDLISNYFTLMDLHTKEIADIKEELKKIDYNTLEELADTHILSNIGLIDKINYVTTGQIKYSLFTKEKQLQLIKNNNLNETLLQEKFHEITVGSSIKFSCYHDKYKLPTSGHSVLIHKKNNDEFFIIDSAHKPHVKLLNATDSSAALNHIFTSNKFDKVAFIDNNAYINKLNTNCINLRYKDEVTNIKKVEDPNKRKGFLLP